MPCTDPNKTTTWDVIFRVYTVVASIWIIYALVKMYFRVKALSP